MQTMLKTTLAALAALACMTAQAAPGAKKDYVYTPANGVNEVKHFHGCFDNTDINGRPKFNVIMNGLNHADVMVEARPVEAGKPSTEMITFRLKSMNASLSVQFRSNDGPHCQQGVESVTFKDAVVRTPADLRINR